MSVKTIRQLVLKMLAKREHSRFQLHEKLRQKGFELEDIEQVLDEMRERNWQSDDRFTEVFVRGRVSRGQGSTRIINELKVRGIPQELALEQLEAQEVDWVALAHNIACKRFGQSLPNDGKEKAKVHRFLAYRGFSSSVINDVYKLNREQQHLLEHNQQNFF